MKKLRGTTAASLLILLATCGMAQNAALVSKSNTDPANLASMDLEKLMDIKVTTASLFSDKLSEAPSIMSVVTSEELQRFGGLTLNEILQTVPGMTGTTQYFSDRSMVAARGDQTKTDGGHILFLINGRPTREVMEGGVISDLMESFPVEILQRIEIIKGPGSVLYGSNAFSAVVNLITKKPDGSNQANVKGTGGADAAVDSSGNFLLKRGNLSAVGAVQLHELPDWQLTYVVPPSQRDLSFAPHVPPIQSINLKDRGTGAYLGANYKALRFMSSFTEFQSTGFIEGTVSRTRLSRDFANLGYDRKLSSHWDSSLDLTFTRSTFKEPLFPYVTQDDGESVAEWTNLFTLGAKDRLSAGALINRIEGQEWYTATNPIFVDAQGRRLGSAFYAQLDHQLVSSVKFIAGFQSNKIGSLSLHTDPRGGVVWTPKPWASVKALYGQAFRAPSLDENLLNNPGLGGNPNLRPEKVATFDLGLFLEGKKVQFGVDYFHSKFTDNIVNLPGPTRAVYFNQGQLTFNGIEIEGKYFLHRDFFLQGSTLYQTNVDGTGVKNLSPIPNIGFKGGVSYAGRNGLTASLFDVSDGPFSGYKSVNPLDSWRNNINGNFRYNLARIHPFGDRMALVAHANNLANQAIWLPSGFSSVDTVPVEQGRTVFAGFEFSLARN